MMPNATQHAIHTPVPWSRPTYVGDTPAVGPDVDVAGATRTGSAHDRNEDQVFIADLNRMMVVRRTSLPHMPDRHTVLGGQAKLLIVADGVGGGPAADRASSVAVDGLAYQVLTVVPWVLDDAQRAGEALRDAVRWCAARVREIGLPGPREPATTLTAALLCGEMMYVVHVGDSRCYLYHAGRLQQLTRDHTLAQILDDEAKVRSLPPPRDETGASSPFRHILCNAVGYGPAAKLQVQLEQRALVKGDVVLLCSDGLTGRVPDTAIAQVLRRGGAAQAMADALVKEAIAAGETDDVTI